jgi:hypothetical protein
LQAPALAKSEKNHLITPSKHVMGANLSTYLAARWNKTRVN